MPMIAITTSSSIRVKAAGCRRLRWPAGQPEKEVIGNSFQSAATTGRGKRVGVIVPLGCPVCKKFMLVHKSVFSLGTGSKWWAPAVTGIHGDPALYCGNRQIACASLTFRRGAPVHVSAGHRGQTHACGFCVAFLGK